MAGLALRHGVNANQLRRWMRLAKQYVTERAPVLLPVSIEQAQVPATPTVPASSAAATAIEIEVAGAVVRVYEGVDARQLRIVLEALRT